MYCIDTGDIAFMFNEGSSCGSTIHPIDTKIAWYIFVIKASDAVLPIFDTLRGRGSSWAEKGTPLLKIRDPW